MYYAEILKGIGGETNVNQALEILANTIQTIDTLIASTLDNQRKKGLIRDKLGLTHDQIRIRHYVNHEYEDALKYYEDLISKSSNNHAFKIITMRNQAECYRSLFEQNGQEVNINLAKSLLDEAIKLADENDLKSLSSYSELYYELSKNNLARINDSTSEKHKIDLEAEAKKALEKSIEIAQDNGDHMTESIASNAIFWRFEDFDFTKWSGIAMALSGYSHGWAIRTYISSTLKASIALLETEKSTSNDVLIDAEKVFLKFSYLTSGSSDKKRAVRLYAGLMFLGSELGIDQKNKWQHFVEQNTWVSDWLRDHGYEPSPITETFKNIYKTE